MALAQTIKYCIARKIGWALFQLVCKSCRISVHGADQIEQLKKKGTPLIYVFWHRHIFYTVYHFRGAGASPLVSLSSDGELIAQIAEEFDMRPVRGSSSRGGAMAFLKLLRLIKDEQRTLLITADGPKGPARQIKEGTIQLAQKSGATIIPISWAAKPVKIFDKSWDQFLLPLPFSRLHFFYGSPVAVAEMPPEQPVSEHMQMLKNRLDDLETAALDALRATR